MFFLKAALLVFRSTCRGKRRAREKTRKPHVKAMPFSLYRPARRRTVHTDDTQRGQSSFLPEKWLDGV